MGLFAPSVKSMMERGDVRGPMEAIVDHYAGLITHPYIFFRPAIPADKLSNALKEFAPGVSPADVLILIDDTLRHSGKGGLLLTDTHVHGKQVATHPVSIALADIEFVSLEERNKALTDKLIVNGATIKVFGSAEREAARLFTRMLQEIVALRPAVTSVEGIVHRYAGLITDSHVFFRPAIPANKLSNAVKEFAPGVSPDDVNVLVDDTLRNSGKIGLLLTDTAVYAKETWKHPVSAPLAAIESVSFTEAKALALNGTPFHVFACPGKETLLLVTRMLQEIVALRSAASIETSPMSAPELTSEAVGTELGSGDTAADAMQAVLNSLEKLCGHPVTFRAVDLMPVPPMLAEELARMEREQLTQGLASIHPAEVEREVEVLQAQVEDQSDDARLWLRGVAWDARREAAVSMFRLGMRGEASGIPAAVRGYTILATVAVRDADSDRRVDSIVALRRVMLDTSAEPFEMEVPLMAGFLLCWLLAEDPDARIRLAASWALGGIPYRSVSAPIGWLSSWLILREAQLVREGRIEMPADLSEQLFALAAQTEAAQGEWLLKQSRLAAFQLPTKLTEITGKAVTTAGGTAHERVEFSSWPSRVEHLLRAGSSGQASFARFEADKGPPLTCLIIHEDREHLRKFPETPSVAVRSRLFLRSGVALVAVIVMVEAERYETWWNYHNPLCPDSFVDLTTQELFGLCFYVESPEPERIVWAMNPLQQIFVGFVAEIQRLAPWASDAFDRERANLNRDFASVASLWEAMGTP